jgi:cobalt-zinc-cadmium efflux system outer membrane protein
MVRLMPCRVIYIGCLVAACAVVAAGCKHHQPVCDCLAVSGKLVERTGQELRPPGSPGWPFEACFEDGLQPEEAVIIALWNNAQFQQTLVDIDLTRADLVQARLLPNPELWYLNPVGVKQLEYAIEFPIEVLWLRPLRIASARFENQRTCERLVQAGLDLIRDVRQAYASLVLMHDRLEVAEENVRLRGHVAQLAEARLKAGDISKLETAAARIDWLQAEQDLVRTRYDVVIAEEVLRNLLGIPDCRLALTVDRRVPLPSADLDVDALAALAVQSRPDALAAREAVHAAERRARLARLAWYRAAGIVDANGQGLNGHEIGPGFRLSIPIFNWGQGSIRRADAELEQAQRAQVTVHNQILLDVRQAFLRYEQARQELDYLEKSVRPEVEAAIRRANSAFKAGDTTYLLVLQSTRQLLDLLFRAAQLHANIRSAWADLERSVGYRLTGSCILQTCKILIESETDEPADATPVDGEVEPVPPLPEAAADAED